MDCLEPFLTWQLRVAHWWTETTVRMRWQEQLDPHLGFKSGLTQTHRDSTEIPQRFQRKHCNNSTTVVLCFYSCSLPGQQHGISTWSAKSKSCCTSSLTVSKVNKSLRSVDPKSLGIPGPSSYFCKSVFHCTPPIAAAGKHCSKSDNCWATSGFVGKVGGGNSLLVCCFGIVQMRLGV